MCRSHENAVQGVEALEETKAGKMNRMQTKFLIKKGMITITKQPNKIERKQPKSPRKKSQSQNKKLREN